MAQPPLSQKSAGVQKVYRIGLPDLPPGKGWHFRSRIPSRRDIPCFAIPLMVFLRDEFVLRQKPLISQNPDGDNASGTRPAWHHIHHEGGRSMPVEQGNKKATSGDHSTNDYLDTTLFLSTLVAVKNGDFSVRLPVEWTGVNGKIADALNDIIEMNAQMARELERVSKVVGKDGRLTQRASLGNSSGAWSGMIESVNSLVSDLVLPTNEMARVIGAVGRGDLSQSIALEEEGRPLQGDVLSTAKTVNAMVEQLGAFTAEVTRVAREVGTDGKLGGQAKVKGVAGTWKDLTDSVNSMAANLTDQVRNIAEVTTAVATGDLSKKITVEVKGEILQLKSTVNTMVDQLNAFASEVTRVAREVGTEGKLGGQAAVRGAAGTWKDLTDNVNQLAGNLTTQVRAIAEVSTAVTQGDLSRSITVQASGEVAALKDNVNQMIRNLQATTRTNTEQDWLKTNLAK